MLRFYAVGAKIGTHQKRTIELLDFIMANGWTDERRARQAALIHTWKPWTHSTGATTPEGKAVSSRNAHRFTQRKAWLMACWLHKQVRLLRDGKPFASEEEARRRFKQCYLKEMDIADEDPERDRIGEPA